VYLGANKLETVKVLLDAGASLDYRTHHGCNVLISAVSNEDADPDVVRVVLEKIKSSYIINYRMKASTLKWKMLYFVSKNLNRTGLSKSGLMYAISLWSGTTALNLAAMRGDVEIVKILLENDADPYVENDLGMNAFDLCDKAGPFPSVKRALQEHVNEKATRKNEWNSTK
jgi:ankyrin repeat protein